MGAIDEVLPAAMREWGAPPPVDLAALYPGADLPPEVVAAAGGSGSGAAAAARPDIAAGAGVGSAVAAVAGEAAGNADGVGGC